MPVLLGLLALLILVPAHIAWFAERNHANAIFARSYLPGIFDAIWWATGAAVGQQQDYPRSALGKFTSRCGDRQRRLRRLFHRRRDLGHDGAAAAR